LEDTQDLEDVMYMPGEAIMSLRMELSNLLGEKLAAGVLFRFGFKCGEALVERMKNINPKKNDIEKILPKISNDIGLGKIVDMKRISEEEMVVELDRSTEANAMGDTSKPICDYTRGYLAGITSVFTNKKFYCVESECLSQGENRCIFHLVVFPHKVYLPKKTS
jgi:predicted hydrocarbon binding protein